MMPLRTCVDPSGCFVYGVHQPRFHAANLRQEDAVQALGVFPDGEICDNRANFPAAAVHEEQADQIFEIANAFPFKGATFIARSWADAKAGKPEKIGLPVPKALSLTQTLRRWLDRQQAPALDIEPLLEQLPEPLRLAVAATSTDAEELASLARLACELVFDDRSQLPVGLVYDKDPSGRRRARIRHAMLFEVLANNVHLPAAYRQVMVLKPGAQGDSEIVGQWRDAARHSHVFEYLRRNSYIPWGHYAANMADDAVRYRLEQLTPTDMTGLRHLYYQRTYVRLAADLGLKLPATRRGLSEEELESLRCQIQDAMAGGRRLPSPGFTATLWGWNFGFDYAPSGYRLHGSHQQIHQQYALIPSELEAQTGDGSGHERRLATFACGDLIAAFIRDYHRITGRRFFDCYLAAIRGNQRVDGRENDEQSLVVHEQDGVLLFVPKAQTSQWELQLMTMAPVGNILEADRATRRALDQAMWVAVQVLGALGARMITTIEYAKRLDAGPTDQRLLYAFLPKMPESPGAFTEAQLRWINGHYPEDFASACRRQLEQLR